MPFCTLFTDVGWPTPPRVGYLSGGWYLQLGCKLGGHQQFTIAKGLTSIRPMCRPFGSNCEQPRHCAPTRRSRACSGGQLGEVLRPANSVALKRGPPLENKPGTRISTEGISTSHDVFHPSLRSRAGAWAFLRDTAAHPLLPCRSSTNLCEYRNRARSDAGVVPRDLSPGLTPGWRSEPGAWIRYPLALHISTPPFSQLVHWSAYCASGCGGLCRLSCMVRARSRLKLAEAFLSSTISL